MSEATPTLEQVLGLRMQGGSTSDIFVSLPARVDAYDAERQCVDATPLVLREFENERGDVVREQLPTVLRAPVAFQGAGPCRITFPIPKGSVVMLLFTSANLSQWLEKGGVVGTQDDRRHSLCSGVAFPGGHSYGGTTKPGTTAPTDAMVLHAPKLLLGGPAATQGALKGTAYRAAEDAFLSAEATFLTALATFTTAIGGVPGMSGAATAFGTAIGVYSTARASYSSAIAGANSLSTVVKLV